MLRKFERKGIGIMKNDINVGWRVLVALALTLTLVMANHFVPMLGSLIGGIMCGIASYAFVPVKKRGLPTV